MSSRYFKVTDYDDWKKIVRSDSEGGLYEWTGNTWKKNPDLIRHMMGDCTLTELTKAQAEG